MLSHAFVASLRYCAAFTELARMLFVRNLFLFKSQLKIIVVCAPLGESHRVQVRYLGNQRANCLSLLIFTAFRLHPVVQLYRTVIAKKNSEQIL